MNEKKLVERIAENIPKFHIGDKIYVVQDEQEIKKYIIMKVELNFEMTVFYGCVTEEWNERNWYNVTVFQNDAYKTFDEAKAHLVEIWKERESHVSETREYIENLREG